MNLGFNSKAQLGEDTYDVQTEDHSASHLIDTLVLNRGRVVYRHSTSYEDLAAAGLTDQAILRARVEKQHRDILDALREGVLSLDKPAPPPAPPKDGELAVKLLNARSWLDAGRVWLDIAVLSKAAGQPVADVEVEAFIEDGAAASESHFGRTDAEGRASLQFPFPALAEPALAALVIRARAAETSGELRYQLKAKKT
jgi:hypothetical protein